MHEGFTSSPISTSSSRSDQRCGLTMVNDCVSGGQRPALIENCVPSENADCFDCDKASGFLGQADYVSVSSASNCVSHNNQSAVFSKHDPVTSGHYIEKPRIPSVCPVNVRMQPRHLIGGIASQMNINAWEYYLEYEENQDTRSYLQDGIQHGFAIVDDCDHISPYYCENYASILKPEAFAFVDNLISTEIQEGKYVLASSQPHCVHSLGAIPKSDRSFRPITDCRRPEGVSINNHMETTFHPFNYITVDHVAANVRQGCYMATVDISAAYRSISIREDHWTYQGINWPINGQLLPLWDARLSFGLRCAPFIFSEISDFVARTMTLLGFTCVANYLDDFLVFGDTFDDCQHAQSTLITLLGDLGFIVSWKKCSSPATCVRYLGIMINSTDMSLSLPEDKLQKLRHELEFFRGRSRATKKQIQRLCGIIAHCSKVVRGGRTFSRRIIDLLAGLKDGNPRIRLSQEFCLDIEWWLNFAREFNGKENIIFPNTGDGYCFSTDSCLQGYGIVSGNDWQAGYFASTMQPPGVQKCNSSHGHWLNINVQSLDNINYLELIPVWLALLRYSSEWKDSHVLCLSDNTQVVAMLKRGHSANKDCMILLRRIFWICVKNNIYVTCRHIPGKDNLVPDLLSRICATNELSCISLHSMCCSGLV